jgi:hypothetical protein
MTDYPALVDRNVEFPARVQFTPVDLDNWIFDAQLQPGTVTAEGTPVNAALFTALQLYIDDTDGLRNFYGTTATAGATADKVVVCTEASAYLKGHLIAVTFTNAHVAATMTLNVNSLGAVNVYKMGSTAFPTDLVLAGSTHVFMYDGTQFRWLCGDSYTKSSACYGIASNVSIGTTGVTNLTLSASSTQADVVGADLVLTSGGIKCLKTGVVQISGSIEYDSVLGTDRVGCYIKNGTTEEIARLTTIGTAGQQGCSMKCIKVDADDIIYLAYRNVAAARGSVLATKNGTYLSVNYV